MKSKSVQIENPVLAVRLFCLLAVCVLLAVLAVSIVKTKDYIVVTGTVTELSTSVAYGNENDSSSELIRTVAAEYTVDGSIYTAEYRTFSFLGKKTGQEVRLHCDAENPEQIRDPFLYECAIPGILFFLFILVMVKKKVT